MRALTSILLALLLAAPAMAERIKDLAHVRGVRPNQLIGYGIVIGLAGTGDSDKTTFTTQSVVAMLARNNVRVDLAGLKLKNVAAVMVTADLPPFSRVGNTIDVTVSSIGDAKSLVGGTLVVTPLKGHDGNIYAVAQGPMTVGGFSLGDGKAGEVKNHPTVARIPDGALVEREVPMELGQQTAITLQLRDADFTTTARLAKVVNMNLGGVYAKARDSGTVNIAVPDTYDDRLVEFLALVERLEVTPDMRAKVVVNERTGTIIMGQDVRIAPVAVAHGNITVSIKTTERAVPAAPLTPGEGQTEQNTELQVVEDKRNLIEVGGTNLSDVVEGLNRLGTSPRDLITILQAIKRAGALRADVEVM
ncbi:MAG: flagellar basal body P-ring protein FlgI [Myxococcales bacterium]|nr:flagellar basal body P-ring protein FlgI [Myxococcales bacterium]